MKNVYLIQPNFPIAPGETHEYYFPYSVGAIWAYAVQSELVRDNFTVADIVFKREPVNDVLNRIVDPALCAFSCYIWNWEYNKKLARLIKERWPECKIVFGGPQVTDKPFEKLFHQQHRYVDSVINGEGEIVFQEILETIARGENIKRIYKQDRIQDLTMMPSPYLTGVFDKIMADNPELKWHAVLETNRGCPYACTFCDWGSATYSKVKKFEEDRVLNEVEWFGRVNVEFVFIADANYGIFPKRDKEIARAMAEVRAKYGYPKQICATWQKNSQVESIEIAKILGSRGFTVSAQSMNRDTLVAIKRDNMKVNNLKEILEYCQKEKIPTYTDLILGLPEETLESWKRGIFSLLDYGQHDMLAIYMAQLLENAELTAQREEYKLKAVQVDNWGAYYFDPDNNLDPVRETHWVVNETSTMPFEDTVECYMFSWMITTFHSVGYTQLVSRYLNNKELMSYSEFYTILDNYIKSSTGLLNQEYLRVQESVTNFLKHGSVSQRNVGMKYIPGDTLMWSSLLCFPKDPLTVKNELNDFISTHYRDKFDSEELYLALVNFQDNYTVDHYKTYPMPIQVPSDVYNTIFREEHNNKTLTLELDSHETLKNLSEDEFVSSSFVKRKLSTLKAIITVNN